MADVVLRGLCALPALALGLVLSTAHAPAACAQGLEAPPLKLTRLDGTPLPRDQIRGKVVLLDFWATWCAPCLVSMPAIADLQARYGKDRLVVLAVSLDDDRAKLDSYLARHPPGVSVVMPTSDFNLAYGRVLKLKGDRIVAPDRLINANLPSWILIDRTGGISAIHKSSTEEKQLLAEAEQLLR